MRRILLVLAVAAITATMMVLSAVPAFAQDDKAQATAASEDLRVYGTNSPVGANFSVSVADLDSDGTTTGAREVPVEAIRSGYGDVNFARFALDGGARVTVTATDISRFSVSPEGYGISPTYDTSAGTMTFDIDNSVLSAHNPKEGLPIRLAIHDNYGDAKKLFIFADPPEYLSDPAVDGAAVRSLATNYGVRPGGDDTSAINKAITDVSNKGGGTLVVDDGVYTAGTVYLKNNVTLYVKPKAMLKGTGKFANGFINYNRATNAHVKGPGVVNMNSWRTGGQNIIKGNGATNSSLEGVLLTGTDSWSIHLKDVNGFNGRGYKIVNQLTDGSDGTVPNHAKNVTIEGTFAHTKDDAFAVKTSSNATNPTDNVVIKDNVLWTQKSALKVGSEVAAPITNVKFLNNDVVVSDRFLSLYGNGNGIASAYTDGVEYRGNRSERIMNTGGTRKRLVEFSVGYFDRPPPYSTIRNVTVADTEAYENSPYRSLVAGKSGVKVSNVAFSNFKVAGVPVTEANKGSYFTVGADTENITFSSTTN